MPENVKINRWMYARWFILRFALVIYDVFVINAAHFLALVIRFYVAEEFHRFGLFYVEEYGKYAIWYTLLCIGIFCAFKLYSGIWKYAGFNDLNRILFASIICFAVHVCGTLLFSMRMPITFYCIGAALQFCLVTASRFSYRVILLEKNKLFSNRDAQIRAMIVGTGGRAKMVLRELEREKDIRPVCALRYRDTGMGSLFDGIPVVNGADNLKTAVEKYQINYVIIASVSMPEEIRSQIKAVCKEIHVEAQDYSGFFFSAGGPVSFRSLAECTDGPVELLIHGRHEKYADGEQALRGIVGRYMVKSVRAESGVVMIELDDYSIVQNDLNADWVRDQEKETGEAISFF